MFFVSCSSKELPSYDPEPPSPAESAVLKSESKIARQLVQKYPFKVIGDSAQMPRGVIKNLGLLFQIDQILTRERAREMLVECVEVFLSEINSNEEIRPYLKNYPFTPKNVTIDIYIHDSKGRDVYDPNIEVASAMHGKLWYATKAKKKKYGYKSQYEETFEEAVKIVQESKK